MIVLAFCTRISFYVYFLCYLVLVVPIVGVLMGVNVFSFKDLGGGCVGRINVFFLRLLLLSISGVPPFIGFFMKAYAIWAISMKNVYFVSVMFCFFAAVRVAYYLNLFFMVLLSTSYSHRGDFMWYGGKAWFDEANVFYLFFFLGVLSLVGMPFVTMVAVGG